MGTRSLLRPDGSEVRVSEEDAGRLLALGYKEKSGALAYEEGIASGTEAHYSDPLSKYRAYREGELSGLSVGISDLVFGDDEDYRQRAHYNPVPRLTGEIVGALGPSFVAGPEAEVVPVMKLAALAREGGEAIGQGSRVVSTMARGAIEGAGFGAGQAITSAKLEGDPLTAEAILAGMGQGALWGGGLAGLGAGVSSRLEARAAAKLAEESLPSKAEILAKEEAERAMGEVRVHGALNEGLRESIHDAQVVEEHHFGLIKSAIEDASSTLKNTSTQVEKATRELDFKNLQMSQRAISNKLVENHMMLEVRGEARSFVKNFALAQQAAKEGNYEKMVEKLEAFKDTMVSMEQKLGGKKFFDSEKAVNQAQELIGVAKERIDTAVRTAGTVADINSIQSVLKEFPKNAAEFRGLRASKVEKLAAAVDALGKVKVGEFAGVQESVVAAIDNFGKGIGVTLEGTPGQRVQGYWKLLKDAGTQRAKDSLKMATEGNLIWQKADKTAAKLESTVAEAAAEKEATKNMSKVEKSIAKSLGFAAGSWTGRRLGIGYPGYVLGSTLVMGLVGLKGAVLGHLSEKAMKWTPKAMRLLEKGGSRMEPLARRLDGTVEDSKKDRKRLMETRIREISEAAPAVRDTLYKAVQPLGIEHPELAVTLMDHAVARFQLLMSKIPSDPGLAYSKLKTMWSPDPAQVEKFSRNYEAFHDPIGVLTRAINTGKLTKEAADFISEADPELWSHFRSTLLERVSDPEINSKITYEDQVQLSALTGIVFHASMDPRFIAAQQQMHTERNQPLEMNPRIQPGGGAGRPAGPGPSATSSQRITEH